MTDPDQSDAEIQDLPESIPLASLRRVGFFIACAFLLISTYLLSIGPAAKLVDSHILPEKITIIYAPLEVIYKQSPITRKFIRWYLDDVWKA